MNGRLPISIAIAIAAAVLLPTFGCHNSTSRPLTPSIPPAQNTSPLFSDVAAQAGVHFTHVSGADGRFYFIETTPAGCAFIDYDNDGFPDILLIQSGPSGPPSDSPLRLRGGVGGGGSISNRPHCALYHNDGGGHFTDVTVGSGLDNDLGYAQGVAIGDTDNDGYDDLFITAYGHNHLFHNERGTGKFRDVTAQFGLDQVTGYATGAAFGDFNNDGKLDLFVCYYSPWSWSMEQKCTVSGVTDYCSPALYPSTTDRLYRNEGDRFTDVTGSSGISSVKAHGLSAAFTDYNGDGRQDVFVANDQTPNMLWENVGNGKFKNVAVQAGCAYSAGGSLMSGMGIGIADYDHSGHESLFITNYSNLPNVLYKNDGNGLFDDKSVASGLAEPHMPYLGFGCEFFDYDADGWPDMVVANGHVETTIAQTQPGVTYAERKQLFHNKGDGTFDEIADPSLLGPLATPTVARGLAVGDYDNDGRLDVLVNNLNGPAQLFHNNVTIRNHWISFKTIGTRSNRDGYHARITVVANHMRQSATVRAGSSYLSHSDSRVYFGLGRARKVDEVDIAWPSGARDHLKDLAADAVYVVTEGRGVTGKQGRKAAK